MYVLYWVFSAATNNFFPTGFCAAKLTLQFETYLLYFPTLQYTAHMPFFPLYRTKEEKKTTRVPSASAATSFIFLLRKKGPTEFPCDIQVSKWGEHKNQERWITVGHRYCRASHSVFWLSHLGSEMHGFFAHCWFTTKYLLIFWKYSWKRAMQPQKSDKSILFTVP